MAAALLCAGAALAEPTTGGPQNAPPRLPEATAARNEVTEMMSPDNGAFCAHLSDMATLYRQRLSGDRPEADALAERGRQLCAAGRMRSGIWHLRHALRELRELPPR